MKIEKIRIHNYRSIRDLEMTCQSLVVMLGPNNHGKSNILSAIEFALSSSSSSKPGENEFFMFRGNDNELWVELAFYELTDQEKTTFKRYIRADGGICFRKTARIAVSGEIEVAYNGYIQEPTEPWLQNDQVKNLTVRSEISNTPLADLVPTSGKLTQAQVQDAQAKYINEHRNEISFHEHLESGPLLGTKNVAAGLLPDFYLIPAVRDLSDETKIASTTAFGRLLSRAVKEMAERDPRFTEIKEGLDKLVKSLNRSTISGDERPNQLVTLEQNLQTELIQWGVNVEIEVVPPEVEKIFQLGTNLHLDDGVKTLAEQKGHGLQRAVIFALVRAWANVLRVPPITDGPTPRASSESIIFGMEEPELFLHPHAQRRLAVAIQQISESPGHQFFICSHSSHFVNLDKYRSIYIISKKQPDTGTTVRQCAEDLFEEKTTDDRKRRFHMAHWVNPDRGEMFFAQKVVFVEGETERTILPYIADKLQCFEQEVSIIDCGSKNNLPLYISIANAFKIPYVVIHDEDPLPDPIPDEWSDDKKQKKRRLYEFNRIISETVDGSIGKVEMLSPDFEGVAGISKAQGDKKGKALAALDYFEEKNRDDIPEKIKDIVKNTFCI